MPAPIEITDYNPRWLDSFAILRDRFAHVLGVLAHRIEHNRRARSRRVGGQRER